MSPGFRCWGQEWTTEVFHGHANRYQTCCYRSLRVDSEWAHWFKLVLEHSTQRTIQMSTRGTQHSHHRRRSSHWAFCLSSWWSSPAKTNCLSSMLSVCFDSNYYACFASKVDVCSCAPIACFTYPYPPIERYFWPKIHLDIRGVQWR